MKTRILVSVIGIPLIFLVICFAPVWCLALIVGAVAAFSAWELLACAASDVSAPERFTSAVCAFAIVFFTVFFDVSKAYPALLFGVVAIFYIFLMISFDGEHTMRLGAVNLCILAGGVLPVMLAAIVRLAMREHGLVFAMIPFIVAFSSDSAGYFGGMLIGRHKLTERLSPNKTIEGSAASFVFATIMMLVYGLILKTAGFTVDFAVIAVYGFLGSLACQLGDLSFSAIKRLCSIKDYGSLIPGHGGVLDRFDSMFWAAAFLEILINWVCAITKAAA